MTQTVTQPTLTHPAEETTLLSQTEEIPRTDAEHEGQGDHAAELGSADENAHADDVDAASTTQENQTTAATPADVAPPKASVSVTKKPGMSVNPSSGKNNGAPTPTVKKILNSGTFGSGSVKQPGTKTAAPSTTKVSAPPLKKASASAPAAPSKPSLASSASSKPASVVASASVNRRASVVPPRTTTPPTKTPLSASTNTKPAPESNTTRTSVVSPVGSVGSARAIPGTAARPRASVSEAVRKTPLASRPTLAPTAKTATTSIKSATVSRSSAAPPSKSSKPNASISSIREVKEGKDTKDDGNAAQEALKAQLEGLKEIVNSKNANVSELENQVETLKASLTQATQEIESKGNSILEYEKAKASAETKLIEITNASTCSKEELVKAESNLKLVQTQLEEAKAASSAQNDLVKNLQSRIEGLLAELSSSKEEIESLKNQATTNAASIKASAIEHENHLRLQADFDSISKELGDLKEIQGKSSETFEAKTRELQLQATTLETQVDSLKAEREENANKQSELEIEILELKEAQEVLEDARESLQQHVTSLEDELAKAKVASALAAESAAAKDTEQAAKLKDLVQQHEMAIKDASGRYSELAASLESIKAQYTQAVAAHGQTKQEILSNEETFNQKLVEVEKTHADTRASLIAETEKVKADLENQESIYNSKVDAVKAEHTQLLEEAYKRAKDEAGEIHAQELQGLRASSSATIDQIQNANQAALEELKVEHATALENETNILNKQINTLSVELKATQDDLLKTKTTLESARTEAESLTKQRDEARAQADAAPSLSPEQADKIMRLTNDLSITKDDLAAKSELLNLTKSSMKEMSDNHSIELEQVAQIRADEVLKLRSQHDTEIAALATQKSELLIKLSDLEGELATLKASRVAEEQASPKHHGNGATLPSSPGVTKEELAKLHEAHNLKIHDLQAVHEKSIRQIKEELEVALTQNGELQQEVGRKAMEIQYLEQEQEEKDEQNTRLQEDVHTLTEKLAQFTS